MVLERTHEPVAGDPVAAVHDRLRAVAARCLAGQPPCSKATALVHEAWLRLRHLPLERLAEPQAPDHALDVLALDEAIAGATSPLG